MNDSVFATIVAAAITMCFGLVLAFLGYRFFLVLLPIFGFFFGLAFGAHSIQALFGDGFLATTSSWVVGFFAGLLGIGDRRARRGQPAFDSPGERQDRVGGAGSGDLSLLAQARHLRKKRKSLWKT